MPYPISAGLWPLPQEPPSPKEGQQSTTQSCHIRHHVSPGRGPRRETLVDDGGGCKTRGWDPSPEQHLRQEGAEELQREGGRAWL